MSKQFIRFFVIIMLQVVWLVTMPMGLFASEPILTTVAPGITGRVWLDANGSGNPDEQEAPIANTPVFIQRIDQPETDVVMTLVVYTDEVGGYSLAGLEVGTYQVWTETNSDSVFFLVVTINENTPTAIVDLPMSGYRVFMPTVMR